MPRNLSGSSQGVRGLAGSAWLGILGLTVTSEVALAMNLSPDQRGVLVEQIERHGPADRAYLRAGAKSLVSRGHRWLVGGDIIVAVDGQPVRRLKDMKAFLRQAQSGQKVLLTLLRNKQLELVTVTLGDRPLTPPSKITTVAKQERNISK